MIFCAREEGPTCPSSGPHLEAEGYAAWPSSPAPLGPRLAPTPSQEPSPLEGLCQEPPSTTQEMTRVTAGRPSCVLWLRLSTQCPLAP